MGDEGQVLGSIRALLREHGAAFRQVAHGPTRTSAESAAARGEPQRIGGKALLVKVGAAFCLFVLSAERELSSRAIRRRLGVRRTRFASADELREMTGLLPGGVPPFGRPILPFDLYVDTSTAANDRIAFNAGTLTDSIVMSRATWQEIARPTAVFDFSRPGPGSS